MIFAKIDVSFRDHAKLLKAIKKSGWGVLGIYSWALMYLREKETEDGVLLDEVIELSMPTQPDTLTLVETLAEVGLLTRVDGRGYYLNNYEKKNETKTAIDERRKATSDRVTRYRDARNGVTNKNVTPSSDVFVPGSDSHSLSVSKSLSLSLVPTPASDVATPIDMGLALSADGRAYAEIAGVSDIDAVWADFKNKCLEKRKVSYDWPATWRAWADRETKFQAAARERDRNRRPTGRPVQGLDGTTDWEKEAKVNLG